VLTLRPTGEADLDSIVAIEAAEDTARWLGETGPDWHERARADPDQDHVVAELDGVIVGFGVMAGAAYGRSRDRAAPDGRTSRVSRSPPGPIATQVDDAPGLCAARCEPRVVGRQAG